MSTNRHPSFKGRQKLKLNKQRHHNNKRNFDYTEYADRIRKTLYYGKFDKLDRPSFPLTGLTVEKFTKLCKKDGLEKLELHRASSICYDACVTPSSLLLAFLYSDRLLLNNPKYLEKTSSSQVFLIAMMVASKYLYDDGEEDEVFNDEWATSAAVLLEDLNAAELEFLFAIDWNVNVNVEEFLSVLNNIEGEVAIRQGLLRGSYTYTELSSISNFCNLEWIKMLDLVGKLLMLCFVSYTTAIATVAISSIIAHECGRTLALSLIPLVQVNLKHFDGLAENKTKPTTLHSHFTRPTQLDNPETNDTSNLENLNNLNLLHEDGNTAAYSDDWMKDLAVDEDLHKRITIDNELHAKKWLNKKYSCQHEVASKNNLQLSYKYLHPTREYDPFTLSNSSYTVTVGMETIGVKSNDLIWFEMGYYLPNYVSLPVFNDAFTFLLNSVI